MSKRRLSQNTPPRVPAPILNALHPDALSRISSYLTSSTSRCCLSLKIDGASQQGTWLATSLVTGPQDILHDKPFGEADTSSACSRHPSIEFFCNAMESLCKKFVDHITENPPVIMIFYWESDELLMTIKFSLSPPNPSQRSQLHILVRPSVDSPKDVYKELRLSKTTGGEWKNEYPAAPGFSTAWDEYTEKMVDSAIRHFFGNRRRLTGILHIQMGDRDHDYGFSLTAGRCDVDVQSTHKSDSATITLSKGFRDSVKFSRH